jgi:hypothetical protein
MRRPLSIRLLSIAFLFAPLAVLFFNAMISMVPLYGPGNVWLRLALADRLILLMYPLTAIAIYLVRPWGWWFMLFSATVLVAYNVLAYLQSSFASLVTMVGMNLALFLVAALFFRKHIIAPYFNPNLRWWEQKPRFDDSTYAKIVNDGSMLLIDNISRGGCFLIAREELSSQRNLFVEIVHGRFHIRLMADVVRHERHENGVIGYGLMFTKITDPQAAGLEEFLSTLRMVSEVPEVSPGVAPGSGQRGNPRFETGHHLRLLCGAALTDATPAASADGDALPGGSAGNQDLPGFPAGFVDISKSGCSILAVNGPELGEDCSLALSYHGRRVELPVRSVWRKPVRSLWKYGLQFQNTNHEMKKIINEIIREEILTGAVPEQRDRSGWEIRVEESMINTPLGALNRSRSDR